VESRGAKRDESEIAAERPAESSSAIVQFCGFGWTGSPAAWGADAVIAAPLELLDFIRL